MYKVALTGRQATDIPPLLGDPHWRGGLDHFRFLTFRGCVVAVAQSQLSRFLAKGYVFDWIDNISALFRKGLDAIQMKSD